MKFVLESLGSSSLRRGRLFNLKSNATVELETPMSVVTTTMGSAPHLTPEVLHKVVPDTQLLCYPAQHFCHYGEVLTAYKKGATSLSGLPTHGCCITVQDVSQQTPSGFNAKAGVVTFGVKGKHTFTVEKYMKLVECMQPDWFEVLNDSDTPKDASKKRIFKSLNSSSIYLKESLDYCSTSEVLKGIGIFAPLLGGLDEEQRKEWSKNLTSATISGFHLLGLHSNGAEAERICIDDVRDVISTAFASIPKDKPRQASGAWNPIAVIDLYLLGVDIFDSSLPHLATERKSALVFPNLLSKTEVTLEHVNKKLKAETSVLSENGSSSEANKKNNEFPKDYEIDLVDKKYFSVEEPLLVGCNCYTCKTFTKSYIHHLVVNKELLAQVLLMIHNLHHWMGFFESIRAACTEKQLHELRQCLIDFKS